MSDLARPDRDPVPGAAGGLRRLAERYHVVIFTARTALDSARRWLAEHGMDGFGVTHEAFCTNC